MNDETRENVCRAALVAPDGEFRPMTSGSCCILGLMRSPLASLSEEALEQASELDIMAFAWVHAADLHEVRAQAVAGRAMPDVLYQHVLAWAETQSPDFFARAYAHLVGEVERIAAGMAVHSKPPRSKNRCGQSGLSRWLLWPVKMASAIGRLFFGGSRSRFWCKSTTPVLVMRETK